MAVEAGRPRKSRVRLSRLVLALIIVVLASIGLLSAVYAFHIFGPPINSCEAQRSEAPNSVYFTIVASLEGFNDSRNHSMPWPVMNISLNEKVTIRVMNNDTTQSHGFSISTYFPAGVTLRPGECYALTFTADRAGVFAVFCTIFCTVHIYMQDGRLVVNS